MRNIKVHEIGMEIKRNMHTTCSNENGTQTVCEETSNQHQSIFFVFGHGRKYESSDDGMFCARTVFV